MLRTKQLFDREIVRSIDAVGLASAFHKITPSVLDFSDQLRFSLVHAVSAFDKYIHDLVYDKLVDIAEGNAPPARRFDSFKVSVQAALAAKNGVDTHSWLGPEIITQHGYLSFQRAEKVADAIRLVVDEPLWPAVGAKLGRDATNVREDLDLIIDRRNKIVHEADWNPALQDRWAMDEASCLAAIRMIKDIGDAIFDVAN